MLTINLEDDLKIKLEQQAENHGHTLEQEVTAILRYYLAEKTETSLNLAERITQRFSDLEDIEIPLITRDEMRINPNFD
jgi:plasmid stability protein